MPVSKTAQTASLVLFLALPALSNASINELPSTEQTIRIDGVLDDDAWQDAIQIEIDVETKPGENITVFFLGYSDALIEDDDLSRLTTTDRTWFMKIGYAWVP